MVVVDGRMSMAVVDGRRSVAEGDGRRPIQHHPRGRSGGQTGPDTLEAHPHPRFIARVIHRFGAWYTRLVALNHNGLNRVYPRLIVF